MAEKQPRWDMRGPVDRFGRPLMPKPTWVGPVDSDEPTPAPQPQPEPEPEPPIVWTGLADPLPTPPLPITRTTPFRGSLDCGEAAWLAEHKRINSPIPLAEQKRCYAAVKPWSAQALACGVKETELGKTARGRHNFLNLFVPAGTGPKDFPSWADGAAEWYGRLSDPQYKGGVYLPRELTVEQWLVTYQAGPECWTSKGRRCANGETWTPGKAGSVELSIRQFVARVNTFMGHPQKVPMMLEGIVTAPAGSPTIYTLDRDFARFGLTAERAAALRRMCFPNRSGQRVLWQILHTQEGNTPGSLGWWLDGYVNGVKVQASATVMIQQDGSILRLIAEDDGPWTNGDTCNPTAKGQAFLAQAMGGNLNLFSRTAEIEGSFNRQHPDVQLDAVAWWVQEGMALHGLDTDDLGRHADINRCSRANCPGDDIWDGVMARL